MIWEGGESDCLVNNAIHNDAGCPPSQVWEIAKRSLLDFTTFNLPDHSSHPTVRAHWSPPPLGFHKINVDGATANNGELSSIGVIIRDHTGTTVGALNKLLPSAFPASIIEAFALLQGVLFAAKLGSTKAIFESDALDPIQAVNTNENGGVLGHILQDIRSSALVFKRSSFQHLKRDGNRVAHELARDAKLRLLSHMEGGLTSFHPINLN
ncbi:hypothetical protein SO802_020321 [Lithocarpus litseifolius]|uniref:RNase H type-1 domain-containing protein n=1 Tax=Lithocarpus litseifolius TaxID=425828 RepID=A0AAW2CF31_9ROSI